MVRGAFAADKVGPTRNPQTYRKRNTAAKGDGEEYNSKRFAHYRDAGPFKTNSLVYFFSRIGKIIHIKSKSIPVLAFFPPATKQNEASSPIILRDLVTESQVLDAIKRAGIGPPTIPDIRSRSGM